MSKKRRPPPLGGYQLSRGDCVAKLLDLPEESAHLVIADPPYNQKMTYDAYDDNLDHADYMAWTKRWLAAAHQALHRHGALWLFAPDDWVSELDVLAKRKFRFTKRRHVVWTFTFGQASQKNFSKSHCHLLYFTKTKTRFTFNPDAVRVPSARQLVYNDPRQNAAGKLPDATWMLLHAQLAPYLTPDKDVWLENRICGTYGERQKHSPNQIPLPLMERIIASTTNPGELVVDPFAGTGAAGVAAVLLGRDYLGFDLSKECVRQSRARIAAAVAAREAADDRA